MKRTRLSLAAILAIGPIRFSDVDGDNGDGQDGNGGTGGAGGDGGSNDGEDGGADDADDAGDDAEKLKRKLANRAEQAKRQDKEIREQREKLKKLDELEKKQEEADRKNRTDVENFKADNEKLKKTNDSLNARVRELTVENAFMTLSDITWHDPSDALRMVDLSDIEFDDETGKPKDPKAIKAAAAKLAKDKPYLTVKKTDAPPSTPYGRNSGRPPGNQNGKTDQAADDAIIAKYNIRH